MQQQREEEPTVSMTVREMAEIVEEDKIHENTTLAMKVQDGRKRINRILEFEELLKQMQQEEEKQPPRVVQSPVPPTVTRETAPPLQQPPPKRVMSRPNRAEHPEPTPQRERELNEKIQRSEQQEQQEYVKYPPKDPSAEDLGLPPEEKDLFGEETTR